MPSPTLACFYFPNYHHDPRNEAYHGTGWSEWELVKNANPRFYGHHQPKIPAWGYEDESDPAVMAKKIDAAADHGIDSFIFDWYYYDDGPFLERGVEQGFMKATNADRMQFGVMWANHDWIDIHPATLNKKPKLLYPGIVTPETFEKMTDHLICNYFTHPSYWCIDGFPWFSVYELHTLMKSFGSVEATAAALQRFREKTLAAGFPGLHLNAVAWGVQILPNETVVKNAEMLIRRMGFDSVTSYVWIHEIPLDQFPETPYSAVMEKATGIWQREVDRFGVPYYPNVTMGWDPSPRCRREDAYENKGYPFMASISGNTPEAFKQALHNAGQFLQDHPQCNDILTLNCWNEWT
ncbi:MAG: glycoside hydrolase family 99-like domain-containing protein, partial [Candidatus Hydrogenedentes bacterium]|nr:glycoside hydrolase family 99-like domain-containing protein [Candidatus Hydrogenedentota bacterium]